MTTRRRFVKNIFFGSALVGLSPAHALVSNKELIKLSILHTNDMHSNIEPFTSGRNKGLGGMQQLSSMIKKVRSQEDNVMLLDAGDVFQGTPYFNLFGGELEFKLMSEMGYDAITLGNHDFDNGIDGLVKQMKHANFSFISSNYDFTDTALEGKVIPHQIFRKDGIKIGVFGVGIELKGLVDASLCQGVKYIDPVSVANSKAHYLKTKEHCDLVICLSHLGFKYKSDKISDMKLAEQTYNIDLIIGGHTHSFLNKPVIIKNKNKKDVLISQVGFGAIKLGKIDFYFHKKNLSVSNTIHNFSASSIDVFS